METEKPNAKCKTAPDGKKFCEVTQGNKYAEVEVDRDGSRTVIVNDGFDRQDLQSAVSKALRGQPMVPDLVYNDFENLEGE